MVVLTPSYRSSVDPNRHSGCVACGVSVIKMREILSGSWYDHIFNMMLLLMPLVKLYSPYPLSPGRSEVTASLEASVPLLRGTSLQCMLTGVNSLISYTDPKSSRDLSLLVEAGLPPTKDFPSQLVFVSSSQ